MRSDGLRYVDFFTLPLADPAIVVLALAVGLAGIGVAVAYVVGDPRSPATRALAFAVGVVGLANASYPAQHVLHPDGRDIWWLVRLPVLDALVMCALLVWMLRVARASQSAQRASHAIQLCVVAFGAVTALYLVLGALLPTERMTRFMFCMGSPSGCGTGSFWIFAIPVGIMGSLLVMVGVLVYLQNVDRAERVRIICVALAAPWFFANYVLPAGYNVLTSLPGLFIFLVGGVRYQTIRGERGQFLSRFLSQEVVDDVSRHGLAHTMQPQKVELTVVSVDLRGFTNFSAAHDSSSVMELIGEYYEAVGQVVASYHATIQAYAGDGITILVGAPLAMPDHAARGLALSYEALRAAISVTQQWGKPACPLGAGIGVASGIVTVGAIEASTRMEYTGTGPAQNLAARLCDIARAGEVLVDARTVELAGADWLQPRGPVLLKGIGEVPHYAGVLDREQLDAEVALG